ncbi:MAG: hypothetical protein QOD39_1483 [Mycobacterium sp.]|jgi:hypothetical protein|nr:hypothetical protein [Mycobacterium sp.]
MVADLFTTARSASYADDAGQSNASQLTVTGDRNAADQKGRWAPVRINGSGRAEDHARPITVSRCKPDASTSDDVIVICPHALSISDGRKTFAVKTTNCRRQRSENESTSRCAADPLLE